MKSSADEKPPGGKAWRGPLRDWLGPVRAALRLHDREMKLLFALALAGIVLMGWQSWRARRAARVPAAAPRLRLDLNTATADELLVLPGVGLVKAERILEHRRRRGPFRTPEDVARVRGISARMVRQWGDAVALPESTLPDMKKSIPKK